MAFARTQGKSTRTRACAPGPVIVVLGMVVIWLAAPASEIGSAAYSPQAQAPAASAQEQAQVTAAKYAYPPARRSDTVDDYHGTRVADPYRWMEDPDAAETAAWVEAENKLTREFIDAFPGRGAIEERLTDLWNYPRYSLPYKQGGRYFFSKNDGLQNQSVLYRQETLESEPAVVLDPNTLSEDGTIAVSTTEYSEDGKLLAYGLSSKGSDWQQVKIRYVETGQDLDEVLDWCKFTSIAWRHDHSSFYYNRFPEAGTVPEEDRHAYSRVYWHTLRTPQSSDVLVYEDPGHKEWGFYPLVTDDGKYLVLYVTRGTDPRNGIYYREVEKGGDFIKLLEVGEAKFDPIDNIGPVMYLNTDLDAPRGRVIAIDCDKPDRASWREVIPQTDDVLHYARMVNNQLVVAYLHDAHHVIKIFHTTGEFDREIALPTIGAVYGLSGERKDTEMFFSFTSFLYPTTAFRYDFQTNEVSVFRRAEIDFDDSQYETKQVFYASKDGTRVPMFITHKRGIALDGSNPTILYGYGGFNAAMLPYFSVVRLLWLEHGGVYAIANIRGGDEYGEEWHQGGILDRKQNVFDDFIAAGEWLIANKYTSTPRLAIQGASNGGLLVAACMIQRPDLFGAVVCEVPVTDMLRYHKFTVGRYWVSDYGSSDDPEQFKFLYAYSPAHNVKEGVTHPATLITTADTDDRVVPMHGEKFAAVLQAADTGANPILIRIETKAGHGGGKPTSKRIEEAADVYGFLFRVFGMEM
jgi:prolyl oligopeptidase